MNPATASHPSSPHVPDCDGHPTRPARSANPLDAAFVAMVAWLVAGPIRRRRPGARTTGQAGQSTVEYALILLGAAAVALVVVAWVTRTDLIGRLFDTVVGRILQQAS